MVYSDTSNKNGIIQGIETWTGLGDAAISGDTTLLKKITAEVNACFDELMPELLRLLSFMGFDDPNQTGTPIKKQDLTTSTNLYTFTTDDNSVTIINITDVVIFPNAAATDYSLPLTKISADHPDAPFFITPRSQQVGTPSRCLILGGKVYLDMVPSYNATNGIKAFVGRQQYQFTTSDTTKTPGLPTPFHALLVYMASERYLLRNDKENGAIPKLEGLIAKGKSDLVDFIAAMNPQRAQITTRGIRFR